MFLNKPKEISQKQLEANIRNAQKSTGPTSEGGKQVSSKNATRHGLTSMVTIMTDPDREAWLKFMTAYVEDLNPEGFQQKHLAQSIAYDAWRMNRVRAIEENIFSIQLDTRLADIECSHPQIHTATVQALTFWKNSTKFSNLSIYEQRIGRGFHKNTALYRDLKKERKATLAAQPPADTAEASKPLAMTATAGAPAAEPVAQAPAESVPSKENGFVYANPVPAAPATPNPEAQTPENPPRPLAA